MNKKQYLYSFPNLLVNIDNTVYQNFLRFNKFKKILLLTLFNFMKDDDKELPIILSNIRV